MELSHLIKLPIVDNVKVSRSSYNKFITSEGTLCLTGHHLIYSSRTNKDDELMVKRINYKTSNSQMYLQFRFFIP